jgi:hypothetical protein
MPLKMKYFVLKPRGKARKDLWAFASQEAMLRYAQVIESEDTELARELETWVWDEKKRQTSLPDNT